MAEKEYIEREAFVDHLENAKEILWRDTSLSSMYAAKLVDIFLACVKVFPAADVAPVRHGRWKKSKGNERPTKNGFVHDDKYVCDCCGWGCCCETKLDFSFCPQLRGKNGR